MEDEFSKNMRIARERMARFIQNTKCRNDDCKEQRRHCSAYCQGCSDKHAFERKKFARVMTKNY